VAPSSSTIGVLRVRGAGEDTPAMRLGLSGVLATGDLRPAAMPPAAVLIVRRLSDPAPGCLPARRRTVRVDRRWEQSAQDALSQQYRRAYRPRRGTVPESSAAVVFEDEAELLACMALDLSRGLVSSRWWWKHVRVPDAPLSAAIERVLIERADRVPAAFALLSESGELASVVEALTAGSAARTLAAVAAASSCEPLSAWINEIAPNDSVATAKRTAVSAASERTENVPAPIDDRSESPGDARTVAPERPPWEAFAGEVITAAMHPIQAALAAVCVAIHRRHASVASVAFARALARWYAVVTSGEAAHAAWTIPARGELPPLRSTSGTPRRDIAAADTASLPVVPDARPAASSRPDASLASAIEVPAANWPVMDHDAHARSPETSAPHTLRGSALFTELGGAFYLVNVMRHLGMPQCFEDDWRLATGAGAWGTFEALARGLLSLAHERHEHDALWTVLAELAGRSQTDRIIGDGCVTPDNFNPPASWGDSRYPADAIASGQFTSRLSPALVSWLTHAVPYVRHRLAEALGVPAAEAGAMVIAGAARIHLTSSHVDVVFPLDHIALPLRMAGLDRDPGWMPAYGRVITFHFE
jgi:hypothetical protein